VVVVQAKSDDYDYLTSIIKECEDAFEAKFKRKVAISIEATLDCVGGVIVTNPDKSIRVKNTLESRLELLKEKMLPEIRTSLFGSNPSRKFFE
jgi:V-type H+-transporting ATPase subunit E